ncbi:LysR family transcriptional regulator [Neisseria perflava]|uniref:LysR family transcriptional regulator n=1 Tax=Neisseria perflava TaxID=33053 RepID=UPI00209E4A1C
MDLKRLKYFCTVVECGSISRAAHALHISQPPLSKRLQELEEELGVALLKRLPNKVESTEAGWFLYRHAADILRKIGDLESETLRFAGGEKRKVNIGLTHLFQSHFNVLIEQLLKRHPDIEFRMTVSDSSHLEDLLHSGEIDVALVQRPNRCDDYDVLALPAVRSVAVIHENLLHDFDGDSITLNDIGHFPLIFLRRIEGQGTFEFLLDKLRKNGIHPNILMSITQPHFIIGLMESGVEAAALLPESEVRGLELKHCRVLRPSPEMLLFFPTVVRLTTHSEVPEILALVEELYLQ